ncbi:MAG: hypothetical protein AB1656_12690 [Candidatus Omnitrophota bacterium]
MTKQAEIQSTSYEKMLLNIVRTLPPERVSELIDFARFLHSLVVKPNEPAVYEEQNSEADKKWEQLLAKPEAQQAMIEMAHEARADLAAGRTTEIAVTEDGRLAPA